MTQQIVQSRKNSPNKFQSSYPFYKLYCYFSRKHGGKRKHGIDRSTYSKVLNEFTNFIRDELIDGRMFYLPFGLGTLSIQEIDSSPTVDKNGNLRKEFLTADWPSTLKWWREKPEFRNRVLYYENDHTDSKRYKTVWDKTTVSVKGSKYYVFNPCRRLSRGLAAKLKDPDYERNYSKKINYGRHARR